MTIYVHDWPSAIISGDFFSFRTHHPFSASHFRSSDCWSRRSWSLHHFRRRRHHHNKSLFLFAAWVRLLLSWTETRTAWSSGEKSACSSSAEALDRWMGRWHFTWISEPKWRCNEDRIRGIRNAHSFPRPIASKESWLSLSSHFENIESGSLSNKIKIPLLFVW